MDSEAWNSIKTFSTTLEFLSIKLDDAGVDTALQEEEENGAGSARTTFPALRHLHVEGTTSAIATVLGVFPRSPIITLNLHLSQYTRPPKPKPDPLLEVIPLALKLWSTSLRQLDVSLQIDTSGTPHFTASTTRKVRRKVLEAAPQVNFTARPGADAFYTRFKDPDFAFKKDHQAVTETLRFGLEFADRLLVTEDLDGAKAMLELLVPLRGKMLREKD